MCYNISTVPQMRTKKRGVDRLLAFRIVLNYIKIHGFNDASAIEKTVAKSKRKPEKPEFSRLFGHGADDGT